MQVILFRGQGLKCPRRHFTGRSMGPTTPSTNGTRLYVHRYIDISISGKQYIKFDTGMVNICHRVLLFLSLCICVNLHSYRGSFIARCLLMASTSLVSKNVQTTLPFLLKKIRFSPCFNFWECESSFTISHQRSNGSEQTKRTTTFDHWWVCDNLRTNIWQSASSQAITSFPA